MTASNDSSEGVTKRASRWRRKDAIASTRTKPQARHRTNRNTHQRTTPRDGQRLARTALAAHAHPNRDRTLVRGCATRDKGVIRNLLENNRPIPGDRVQIAILPEAPLRCAGPFLCCVVSETILGRLFVFRYLEVPRKPRLHLREIHVPSGDNHFAEYATVTVVLSELDRC